MRIAPTHVIGRLVLGLSLLGALGCRVEPGPIDPGSSRYDAGTFFVDTVVGINSDGQTASCGGLTSSCGTAPPTSPPCYPNAALGPTDGMFFELAANGTIAFAFRCGQIVDRNAPMGVGLPDFRVLARVPEGATAIVEVSDDGFEWRSIGILVNDVQAFDIRLVGYILVRYVRIRANATGGIGIDALEAL